MAQKDVCTGCTAHGSKLKDRGFHALRRLPTAGVFFGSRQPDSAAVVAPDGLRSYANFECTNIDYEWPCKSPDAHDRSAPQTEKALIAL